MKVWELLEKLNTLRKEGYSNYEIKSRDDYTGQECDDIYLEVSTLSESVVVVMPNGAAS